MMPNQYWPCALMFFVGCSHPSQPASSVAMDAEMSASSRSPDPKSIRDAAVRASEANKAVPQINDEEIMTEEHEPNPYSETVTLKLRVTPQVKALVMWGGKQVARLSPGNMDAEISRPRGSGPLDLEIKSEGFMPYHTRLYADRSDKVNVRLYRPEEAPGLFGYKRAAEMKMTPAAKNVSYNKK